MAGMRAASAMPVLICGTSFGCAWHSMNDLLHPLDQRLYRGREQRGLIGQLTIASTGGRTCCRRLNSSASQAPGTIEASSRNAFAPNRAHRSGGAQAVLGNVPRAFPSVDRAQDIPRNSLSNDNKCTAPSAQLDQRTSAMTAFDEPRNCGRFSGKVLC